MDLQEHLDSLVSKSELERALTELQTISFGRVPQLQTHDQHSRSSFMHLCQLLTQATMEYS